MVYEAGMQAALSMMRGVVFDLNGTLVDDIRFHFDAWSALAEELGLAMDEARFSRSMVSRTRTSFRSCSDVRSRQKRWSG